MELFTPRTPTDCCCMDAKKTVQIVECSFGRRRKLAFDRYVSAAGGRVKESDHVSRLRCWNSAQILVRAGAGSYRVPESCRVRTFAAATAGIASAPRPACP